MNTATTPDLVIAGSTRHPGGTRSTAVAGSRLKARTATFLFLASTAAFAQPTPVGTWRNVDDKSGEAKAEIRIVDNGGVLTGTILRSLKKDSKPDAVCEECRDERKGKPIAGLEIIRGARKAEGHDVWEHGKILDPENGREYTLRLAPIEGGQKLQVRGYLGPFFRTQTWVRVN